MKRIPERSPVLYALACVLAAAFSLSGCTAVAPRSAVRVDQAEGGLPKCRTFDWLPASKDAASLTEQRVRAAVMEQLEAKGYEQATEKPDCRVTYLLDVQDQPTSKPRVGVGAGGGSGGIGGGIGVSLPIGKSKKATITLDVIDTAKNAQVWSGSIDASVKGNELSEEEARSVAKKILAEFPDRAPAN